MQRKLFPTTVVGSYPQPEWLIDRSLLAANTPPRVRMRQLWRIAPERLERAQDDATLIAIRDQERAGIDVVSDGEMRRESYFNHFATALDGIDLDNPGTVAMDYAAAVNGDSLLNVLNASAPTAQRRVTWGLKGPLRPS